MQQHNPRPLHLRLPRSTQIDPNRQMTSLVGDSHQLFLPNDMYAHQAQLHVSPLVTINTWPVTSFFPEHPPKAPIPTRKSANIQFR